MEIKLSKMENQYYIDHSEFERLLNRMEDMAVDLKNKRHIVDCIKMRLKLISTGVYNPSKEKELCNEGDHQHMVVAKQLVNSYFNN